MYLNANDDVWMEGKDIHVFTTAQAIGSYMGGDRSSLICYRCGQTGHVRFQCLQFKIRLCQHYLQGQCHERYCTFAHGTGELRTPWKLKCVRLARPSVKPAGAADEAADKAADKAAVVASPEGEA